MREVVKTLQRREEGELALEDCELSKHSCCGASVNCDPNGSQDKT